MNEFNINHLISPAVTNDEMNALFPNVWEAAEGAVSWEPLANNLLERRANSAAFIREA